MRETWSVKLPNELAEKLRTKSHTKKIYEPSVKHYDEIDYKDLRYTPYQPRERYVE